MDILEPNLEVKQELLKIINDLQWGANTVDIKGSASLASQKYFGDFDLFSIIKKNNKDPFKEIVKIIKRTKKNPDMYFIELKIQYVDQTKYKLDAANINKLDRNQFEKDIEYIKLDYVIRLDNLFFLLSINYFLAVLERGEVIKELRAEKRELIREGNFFKALKRQFSIFKADGRKDKLVELTRIFNSEIGRKNQVLGNFEAIKQLMEHGGKTGILFKKIVAALKDMGYNPPSSAPDVYNFVIEQSKNLLNQINDEAKQFI